MNQNTKRHLVTAGAVLMGIAILYLAIRVAFGAEVERFNLFGKKANKKLAGLQKWAEGPPSHRIAVLMVDINFAPAKVSAPAWAAYCSRHGYDFVHFTDANYDDPSVGIAWWRVRIVHNLLASGRYSAVMHVDADTVPCRPELSIEEWMAAHGSRDTACWLSQDMPEHRPSTHDFGTINFGVFVMKRDGFCRALLRRMWAQRFSRTEWPREQGCLEDELQIIWRRAPRRFLDKVYISSYGEMQHFSPEEALRRGVWVFHAPGYSHPDMYAAFEKVLNDTVIDAEKN